MEKGAEMTTQPDDKSTWITRSIGKVTGSLGSFPPIVFAVVLVVAWFLGGFFVSGHFANNTYQLLINTGTTIITFLMVFVIQNTHNRDGRAVRPSSTRRARSCGQSPNGWASPTTSSC